MNHFVFEKMQQEAASRIHKDDSVDYFEYQQQYSKRFKQFMDDYKIKLDKL
jgi:hypothetical protein